jgi:hypothetical protein
MSYIVDSFPSEEAAEDFIEQVNRVYPELECLLFVDATEADDHDVFPRTHVPPIVHVERLEDDDLDQELYLFIEAPKHGGVFAGA